MLRLLKAAMLFSGALLVGAYLGATPSISPAYADAVQGTGAGAREVGAAAQPPFDPNKKKEGELCKTSDECQKHHTCTKIGETSVCQAPPRQRLPPGAVT